MSCAAVDRALRIATADPAGAWGGHGLNLPRAGGAWSSCQAGAADGAPPTCGTLARLL